MNEDYQKDFGPQQRKKQGAETNRPCKQTDAEKVASAIAAGFSLVGHEVCKLREQKEKEFEWYKSHHGLATKDDLKEMEKRIMASQAEIVAELKAAIVSLKQVNTDIAAVQTTVTELKAKIVELEAIIAAGGTIGQELVDAVAEVKALANAADEGLPNPVVVPPPA